MYGVDSDRGAIVLVRPDGYVGAVYQMEDIKEVVDYFGNFLVQAM
jgi:phenol 2-monooxygenase